MSIKKRFNVYKIPYKQAKPWILKKHYAHRMPSVSYAFGLYDNKELVGICTFGITFNYAEDDAWGDYDVYELNRLITEDDLPKNALSYFVSHSLNKMPEPSVVISYADEGQGHKGYIYQATNWIYTGKGGKGVKIYCFSNGKKIHQRSLENPDEIKDKIKSGEIEKIIRTEGKHRYYYFVGNKREKRKMKKMLRYEPQPYPKGENKNYDIGEEVHKQQRLF